MYQTGDTIRKILYEIERHDIVLPAIQREFVWKPEQICQLFDSIMQGYPFGTFLYWKVQPENSTKFQFYDFVLNYHERDDPHCPQLSPMPNRQLTAVLDGQQRLTALNIGLRGTMAWKLPYKFRTNPDAFPERRLYLDLLWNPDEEDETGRQYHFDFLTEKESQESDEREGECYFPVADILPMAGGLPMVEWLNQRLPQEQVNQAFSTLDKLHRVVHAEKIVAFYEERSQELEKVLQIFIRTNSGGTILSYSDLLLSVAVALWRKRDAREEIHALVDELNRIGSGFFFSQDLVLKAGLMLSDIGSVGFKVDNFNRENMAKLEEKWNDIKQALILTVQLVSRFGFNGQTLSADSSILPIAYYLYMRDPGESYLTNSRFKQDRQEIRKWLIRSLLKAGIWGSGLDTLLTALRQIIKENSSNDFPVTRIREEMTRRGKSLVFEKEELEELADMQYGNKLTFALLSQIFPFIDLSNHFHIDHIFPQSRFTDRRLRDAGVPDDKVEDFKQLKNGLANLQLLQGPENNEKRAKMPADWLSQMYRDDPKGKQADKDRHLLGEVPEEITEFDVFYAARRARLKSKIDQLLGS